MNTKDTTSTDTLIAACRELANTVQSGDGVANAALHQVADRLAELHAKVEAYRADAIKYHLDLVEAETVVVDREHGWESLSDACDNDDEPARSVAFLVAEGLAEMHPTRAGVFRVIAAEGGGS